MTPNEGQARAIAIQDRAVLVSAGAGTGKTWTLTQRFIHLLEQHPDWPIDSIVAVTFTEKAAREMRTRIRQSVERRAAETGSPAWGARRRELDRLQVSTVHSLCSRILREHAIAAGIDPHFTVLDEQAAEILKEDALRQTLVELSGRDAPGLELLVTLKVSDLRAELARLLDQRGTVKRIFAQLGDGAALLERWRAGVEELHQALWRQKLLEFPALEAALQTLPGVAILDPTDGLSPLVENAQVGCRYFAAGDWRAATRAWTAIKVNAGRAANWGGKDALTSLKEDLKILREVATAHKEAGILDGIGPADEAAAQALQHWRSLWDHLESTYSRLKDGLQALDFDDLELLTLHLLQAEPRDPRLVASLDGFQHVMVDEFQDTNLIQRDIVYALAPPEAGGRLFVVGDAKQSIYRFRQAQVSVFAQVQADITRITGLPAAQAAIPLEVSFRTQPDLIQALNALFEQVLRPAGPERQDYEAPPGPLQAHRAACPPQPQAPAPVEVWFVPSETAAGERVDAEEGRILEARILAGRLLELERDRYQVWDRSLGSYRPFQFKDAAILFRATTSLPLYETQFKAAGLPYLTVSGRGYYDRPEIQDLTALLAALHNRFDDLNLAAVLRSPLFSLSDETLFRLRWQTGPGERAQEPIPFHQALQQPPITDQSEAVAEAGAILAELWALAGRADPWRILRRALDLTAYETTLAMSDGASGRQRSNVQKFMAYARTQSGASLSEFLRSLQDLKAREAREGEALGSAPESGAVQLMSIHAAKGLEFPVVCVADLGRDERGLSTTRLLHDPGVGMVCQTRDGNGDWQKPAGYAWAAWKIGQMEAAESKRLLYVACTRAADLLILSGKQSSQSSWLSDVQRCWEIASDAAEEILARDGYSLRLVRPTYQPLEQEREEVLPPAAIPAPASVPALIGPVDLPGRARPLAVTRLERAQPGTAPELRPAVRRARSDDGRERAPHYQIGQVIHRALADWGCLDLPPRELAMRLRSLARSEGITPPALEHAVDRCQRMLAAYCRSALYAEIQASTERYSEIPFVLNTPAGIVHGQVDFLYRTPAGEWRFIDWKTDWVAREGIAEHASREYLPQMAIYAHSVAQAVGQTPRGSLCFLALDAHVYTFAPEELAAAFAELLVPGHPAEPAG